MNRQRDSYGRALDTRERRAGSSERRGEVPFRPAYQPQEPKRPKGGLIVGIIVVVALVLVALFLFPGFLRGCSSDAGNQAAPGQGTSGVESTSGTSTSALAFDAKKAESAARDAALDADKQVLTGTVRATTMKEQAESVSEELAAEFADSTEKLVLLELEGSPSIEARSAGDEGLITTVDEAVSLRLDDSYAALDGQKITVAVHEADLMVPSDVAGSLYTATADNVVVIAPLTANTAETAIESAGTIAKSTRTNIDAVKATEEQRAKEEAEAEAQHQAEIEAQWQAEQEAQWQAEQEAQWQAEQAAQGYYIIPDSNWRYLSRDELEGYSTYDLYLARNEIYARNGRMFTNQDLQSYFNSQGWYSGTVAPGDFDTMWMSQVERDNAILIRQIEEERNSPYL